VATRQQDEAPVAIARPRQGFKPVERERERERVPESAFLQTLVEWPTIAMPAAC